MLYFYTTSSIVGLFTQHHHKYVKNTLHYDVTIAVTSLGRRTFSDPFQSYGTTVVYVVCQGPKHYVVHDYIAMNLGVYNKYRSKMYDNNSVKARITLI